jgi:hypothetical protein
VVHHDDGHIVAVCECDPWNCDNIELTGPDVVDWEFNRARLGRALCRALDLERREQDVGLPWTQQVATFSAAAVPVVVTIPLERGEFHQVVAELAARWREGFILFAPTSRFMDGRTHELLSHARAKFFDLESHVTLLPNGTLHAPKRAGELFAQFGTKPDQGRAPLAARYLFRQAGSMWRVVFDGSPEFHVEDTLGAKYLGYLLHHPNEPISTFDLEVAIAPEKGQVRDKDSIQNGIDGEAVRNYLRELEQLRADRDGAAEDGDAAEADRLDGEIETIAAELKRRGQSVDTGERARGNVSKAIMAVRRKLLVRGTHEKAFGEHVAEKVSLGYQCCYTNAKGGLWD